ncbi:MAG: hypothetical protein AAB706_04375 [Patescibacteria group bacterium]
MDEQKEFQKRIENVEGSLKKALEDNKLELNTKIDFPKYRELPIYLQLALALLEEEKATIIRSYKEKIEKPSIPPQPKK